jgi:hypothetical protein
MKVLRTLAAHRRRAVVLAVAAASLAVLSIAASAPAATVPGPEVGVIHKYTVPAIPKSA